MSSDVMQTQMRLIAQIGKLFCRAMIKTIALDANSWGIRTLMTNNQIGMPLL